jgi:hypothetical protein
LKSELHKALEDRFGEHRISKIPSTEGEFPLLIIDLELSSPVTVLMTDGLSNYKMPVAEKLSGREYNELYFCLPSYWDWQDLENPNTNWIYSWIRKMANHAIEKETWYGPGHSFPTGKEKLPISATMKQNHFFLTDPIVLEQELAPLSLGDKTVYFLGIVPIFSDEMDYKQARGTFKLLQKFSYANVSEKLDDFRSSVLRSRWRLRK